MDVTLIGNRGFADVIRLKWGHAAVCGSWFNMIGVLITRGKSGHRHTGRGGLLKMEAEFGVMRPQAKECLEPPGAGRGRKDSSLEPLEGGSPGTPGF